MNHNPDELGTLIVAAVLVAIYLLIWRPWEDK